MKTILLLVAFAFITSATKSQISRQEAINTIAEEVVGLDSLEVHYLYSRYEKLFHNDTLLLDLCYESYIAPFDENWVFFVDMIPIALWAHTSKIIFLDAISGEYVTYNDNFPPYPFLDSTNLFFEKWEWILSVSTEEISVNNKIFNLYPNPFINEISITYENNKSKTLLIKILDVSGKSIICNRYTGLSVNGEIVINTSDIKPGIFFVQIQTIGKTLYVEKIVK